MNLAFLKCLRILSFTINSFNNLFFEYFLGFLSLSSLSFSFSSFSSFSSVSSDITSIEGKDSIKCLSILQQEIIEVPFIKYDKNQQRIY